jgi:hypothetical protein
MARELLAMNRARRLGSHRRSTEPDLAKGVIDMKGNRLGLNYWKAPRATFALRHPKAAIMSLLASQGLRRSRTIRRAALGLVGLGVGIGAASVAVPVLALRVWGR